MIKDCMKEAVISISHTARVRDAVRIFQENQIGTLPIVDDDNKLVGIVLLRDLLDLVMPDFLHLLENIDFIRNFGALVDSRQPAARDLDELLKVRMHIPVSVHPETRLLQGAAVLHKHDMRDVPVVDDYGRLVGLASHVDIGRALMKNWQI